MTFELLQPLLEFSLLRAKLGTVEQVALVGNHGQLALVDFIIEDLGQLLEGGHADFGLEAADDVLEIGCVCLFGQLGLQLCFVYLFLQRCAHILLTDFLLQRLIYF